MRGTITRRERVFGRLWWTAENEEELKSWRLEEKGVRVLSADRGIHPPQIEVVFEIDKKRARRILGYVPGDWEYLKEGKRA